MEWTTRTHARTHAVQCRGVLDVFDNRLGIYEAAVGMPPNVERLTRVGISPSSRESQPRVESHAMTPTPPPPGEP